MPTTRRSAARRDGDHEQRDVVLNRMESDAAGNHKDHLSISGQNKTRRRPGRRDRGQRKSDLGIGEGTFIAFEQARKPWPKTGIEGRAKRGISSGKSDSKSAPSPSRLHVFDIDLQIAVSFMVPV